MCPCEEGLENSCGEVSDNKSICICTELALGVAIPS